MRATIKAGALARALGVIEPLTSSRFPVTECALLHAGDGALGLASTNLDSVATAACQATVVEAGSVCVSAKRLAAIAASYPKDSDIGLLLADQLAVSCGTARTLLPIQSVQDFPAVDIPAPSLGGKVRAEVLAGVLAKTVFAAGESNAAQLTLGQHGVSIMATNGHHGALCHGPAEVLCNIKAALGKSDLEQIATFVRDATGEIRLSATEDRVWVEAESSSIVIKASALIAPDFGRAVAQIRANTVEPFAIPRHDLLSGLRRAVMAAPEKKTDKHDGQTAVTLKLVSGSLSISAESAGGQHSESFPIDYTGPEAESCFSSGYLRQVLSVISDGATLALPKEKQSGCVIAEGESFQYALMSRMK